MGRWSVGDVFVIPCGTSLGLAQLEARGQHWRTDGDWVRVLPDLFEALPDDVCAEFVLGGERGWLERGFLKNWVWAGDMAWVAHCAARRTGSIVAAKLHPTFTEDGRVITPWIVFDGSRELWFDILPEKYDDLPSMALKDGRTLCERIGSGWTPRHEVQSFGRACPLRDDDWEYMAMTRNLEVSGLPGRRIGMVRVS